MHRLLLLILFFSFTATAASAQTPARPKNVILFIADGAGPASFTMARDYIRHVSKGTRELALDAILTGAVQTHATNSRITDSAASASAYATGVKTYSGAISVDTLRQPVRTVVEEAEARGLATGLVATTRITHATPAAFSSHVPDRNMEAEIAAQQLDAGVDVLLGGGRRYFLPAAEGGTRTDERDLTAEAIERGYTLVRSRQEFDTLRTAPVLGLLAMDQLSYEIDRDSVSEPSLAEMTARAIELLQRDPEGFFLMVEGSRIDHAAHSNDPAGHLHDLLAFDEAVAAALAFAREDGETLVVVTSDHETGGLTLGREAISSVGPDGTELPFLSRSLHGRSMYDWNPAALQSVVSSVGPMAEALQSDDVGVEDVFRTYAGIDDLTGGELELLAMARQGEVRMDHAIGEIISRRAGLGWTTGGHTGVDVNLYAFGPGSERFRGNLDNTEVGRHVAELLGIALTGRL